MARLTKPPGGQAIVLHLDGTTTLSFSDIVNENVTLVHAGDKLIILFDNRSTITIDPVFDAGGHPLQDVTFQLGPDRTVSSAEFATLFPITTDQSVLPAAGDTGGGAPTSGGNFSNSFTIDALTGGTPLGLLGPSGPGASGVPSGTFNAVLPTGAHAPVLTAHDVGGNEDAAITLGIFDALGVVDSTSVLGNVTITGVPAGAALSAGTHNPDGSWTLTPAQLSGLTLTGDGEAQHFALSVTATTIDAGITASTTANMNVTVNPVADPPTLDVSGVVGGNQHATTAVGNESTAIALKIAPALSEADPDAVVTVTITNVPTDAVLNHGTNNHDGSWTLSQAELTGLTITPGSSTDAFTLGVTAITTDGGNAVTAASTSGTIAVTVNPVADAPTLAASDATAAAASLNEDSTVALTITPHFETDPDATNTITIGGLPTNVTLTNTLGDTFTGSASYTLTAAQLAGLTLHTADDDTASISLSVQAHASEGSTTADSAVQTINLLVTPVAEAPTLDVDTTTAGVQSTTTVAGNEDKAITLNVASSLIESGAADPDATLAIKISGVPTDAAFNHGTNNHDGTWSFAPADLTGLQVAPGSSTDSFTLTVTATTTDGSSAASTVGTIAVTVNPVADAPALDVDTTTAGVQSTTTVAGNEDEAITLNITSTLIESVTADPDATLAIQISGVPTDATFNHGTNNHDGTWSFVPADLTGLQVTPGSSTDSFTLTVTATTTEASNGATASTTGSIAVTVNPVADAPALVVIDTSGQEDSAIALTINPALTAEVDPDASLSLTITGIPSDAILSNSAGVLTVSGGSITFSSTDLANHALTGLQITPPAEFEGTFQLSVTATATDGASQTPTTKFLTVDVAPVADPAVITNVQPFNVNNSTVDSTGGTDIADDAFETHMVALAGGGFVETWAAAPGCGCTTDVFAQVFDANNQPVGAPFVVGSNDGDPLNLLVALKGGGFAVTFVSGDDIFVQTYDAQGSPVGVPQQVDSVGSEDNVPAQLIALNDGGFAVLYDRTDFGQPNVYTRVFAADGTPSPAGEVRVNDIPANDGGDSLGGAFGPFANAEATQIVPLAHGYAVMWEAFRDDGTGRNTNTFEVLARVFNSDGSPASPEIQLGSPQSPALDTGAIVGGGQIVALTNDDFAVLWQRQQPDGSVDVLTRVFHASDNYSGSPETVTSSGSLDPAHLQSEQPSQIVALGNGGYAVLWTQADNTSGNSDVFVQVYDANGHRTDANPADSNGILVDTATSGVGTSVAEQVLALSGGHFAVMWEAGGVGPEKVFVRVFNADGTAATDPTAVNPAPANGNATYFGFQMVELADGGFAVVYDERDTGGSGATQEHLFVQQYTSHGIAVGTAVAAASSPFFSTPGEFSQFDDFRLALSKQGVLLSGGTTEDDGAGGVNLASLYTAVGQENTPVTLLNAAPAPGDGTDALTLTLTGFPAGATFSVGHLDTHTGNWVISAAEAVALATTPLTVTPPPGFTGNFTLHVDSLITDTVTLSTGSATSTAHTIKDFSVTVNDVNDVTLSNTNLLQVTTGVASPITLGIAAPVDADHNSDTTITLDAVPSYGLTEYFNGITFVAATAGTVLTVAELESLRFTPTDSLAHHGDSLVYSVADGPTAVTGEVRINIVAPPTSGLYFAGTVSGTSSDVDLFTVGANDQPTPIPVRHDAAAPFSSGSDPGEDGGFIQFAGNLYFFATDPTVPSATGGTLFRLGPNNVATPVADGTGPGNFINDPGTDAHFTIFDGNLYLEAVTSQGDQLVRIDAAGNAHIINSIDPGTPSLLGNSFPGANSGFTQFDGNLYFSAHGSGMAVGADDLFKLDPEGNVTALPLRTGPNAANGSFAGENGGFVDFAGGLYFNAFTDAVGQDALFKLDANGVAAPVLDAHGHVLDNSGTSSHFHVFNGDLYFTEEAAPSPSGLYSIDPSGVVTQIAVPTTGPFDLVAQTGFADLNGSLYFAGSSQSFSSGSQLFKLDSAGPHAGTPTELQDTSVVGHPASISDAGIDGGFVAFNGSLYFIAADANTSGQDALFRIDSHGNVAPVDAGALGFGGQPLFVDVSPGGGNENFTVFDNSLYFRAFGVNGDELFRIDSSGAAHEISVNADTPTLNNNNGGFGTFVPPTTLFGTSGNDILVGGAHTVFIGGKGNDALTGAGSHDTAIFSANFTDPSTHVTLNNGTITVSTADGTDTTTGMDRLQFADKGLLIVDPTGHYGFSHVQDAVNAATAGDVIWVLPGTYTESTIPAGVSSTPGGLYINTPNLTLQGVLANGTPIATVTDGNKSTIPTIISGHETDFGSNIFVGRNGDNTTIEGLHLQAGPFTTNKVLEIWANNVTVDNSWIDVNADPNTYALKSGPNQNFSFDPVTGYTGAAAIYFNDTGTSTHEIASYDITHNILDEGIIVSNGVGDATLGVGTDQLITDNRFEGTFNPATGLGRYDTVAVNGKVPGIGWLLESTQFPTITGNTFGDNTTPFLLRGSDVTAAHPTAADVVNFLATNGGANTTYAFVEKPSGDLELASRNAGSGLFFSFAVTNTIDTLNLALDATPDSVFPDQRIYMQAGDTVVIQSGATGEVNSQIMVNDLTVKATANSADLDLTLATHFADGTLIPVGVQTLTLADYAAGQGANIDVTGNNLGDTITVNSGSDTLVGGTGVDTAVYGQPLSIGSFSFSANAWHVAKAGGANDTITAFEKVQDSAGHHFFLVGGGSQYTIQQAVNAAADGDTILIAPGTYSENVAINGKALTIEGFGGANGAGGAVLNGSITETGALNGALTIDGIAINATGQQNGISITPTLGVPESVTISDVSITGASQTGLAVNGGGTDLSVNVEHSTFSGNGVAKSFGGSGDIDFFQFTGNAAFDHVAVIGTTGTSLATSADNGIQIAGFAESNKAVTNPIGNVSFNDVSVIGTYAKNLVYIQGYDDATHLTFPSGGLMLGDANSKTGWTSLFVDLGPQGGPYTLDASPPSTLDLTNVTLAGWTFAGTNPTFAALATAGIQDIILGTPTDDVITGTSANDLIRSLGGNDTVHAGAGNDTIVYDAAAGGTQTVDGGTGTNTEIINGTSTASTYNINPTTPTELGVNIVAGTTPASIVAADAAHHQVETTNIEEIVLNLGNNGNQVELSGDLHGTGVATSTVTVNGGTGDDTVDASTITGTPLDVVFNGGGGNDTFKSGPGNDTFADTGRGTAVYSETLAATNFAYNSGHWTLMTSSEGSDTLSGVDKVNDGGGHHFLLVSVDSQYTTIQAAVDAAQAGDTILIAPGTYHEQVLVDPTHGHGADGITIQGIGSVTVDAPTTLVSTGNSPTNGRDIDGVVTVHNATNVSIENIAVNGLQEGGSVVGANNPTLVGIAYLDASGTVDHADVTGVREGTLGFGDQRGIGIYVSNATLGANFINITNSSVEDFQKGGIVISNAVADVTGNTVTGAGATDLNAQNGIQLFDSTGDVSNNVISAIGYVPTSFTSTGILFWDTTSLNIVNNHITGASSGGAPVSDTGIVGINSSGVTITGNQIANVLEGIVAQEDASGGFAGTFAPTWTIGNSNVITNATQQALDFEATDPANGNAQAGGDFTVAGTDGNDLFVGGAGHDHFSGGAGNDTFDYYLVSKGGPGQDTVDGGTGSNTESIFNVTGSAETFNINPITIVGDPNSYVGVHVAAGADAATASNYQVATTNVQEIVIHLGNAGDTVLVSGNLNGTGILTSTITVDGGTGNDTVDASAMSSSYPVDVVFNGGGGNDTFKSGPGNDTFISGGGNDTAIFSGDEASYTISVDAGTGHVIVADSRGAAGNGTDTLEGIAHLQFANATLGPVLLFDSSNHLVHDYTTIGAALSAAQSLVGNVTIDVASGTYNENVTISRDNVTLVGAGDTTIIHGTFKSDNGIADGGVATFLESGQSYTQTAGHGITIAANNDTVQNLRVDGFQYGVELGNGINGDTIDHVDITDSLVGIRKGTTASISGLSVNGGSISDGLIGVEFDKDVTDNSPAHQTSGTADGVTIDGTDFNDLVYKGIYAEALSNAHLTGIDMTNVGQFGAPSTSGTAGTGGDGIDLNLKNGTYSNVTIDNFHLTHVGESDQGNAVAHPVGDKNGGAIVIEARDQGSYAGVPGEFTGAVHISNGTIDGNTSTGIQAGEPSQANAGPAVDVSNVSISGAEHNALHGDIANVTQSTMTIAMASGDDTLTASPTTTGNLVITANSGNDTITAGAGNDTFIAGAGNDTFIGQAGTDTAEFAGTQSAAATFGFAGGHWTVTVGGHTDTLSGVEKVQFADKTYILVDQLGANVGGFQSVQSAIDAAAGGETILVAPGTYTESAIPTPTSATFGGLFIDKPNLSLQGVKSDGSFISSAADAQNFGATIVSGAQTDFGSNHFIGQNGSGTTIEGLHLQAGAHSNNKLVEITADNVTIENDFIDSFFNGADTGAASIYVDSQGTPITQYLIDRNILNEGIYVASGVGAAGTIGPTQVISNNEFAGTFNDVSGSGRLDMVAVQGQIPGIGWQPDHAQVPTIDGNTRADNTAPFLFRVTEADPTLFPTAAQVATILADNADANTTYAYVLDPGGSLHLVDRDITGFPHYNALYVANGIDTLNLALDQTPDAVFGGFRDTIVSGDTVIVQSGASEVNSQIMVDNLTVDATASSTDLDLTLATKFADGSTIPVGVTHLTLADYASGQGANVDVTANNLGDSVTVNSGNDALIGGAGIDTALYAQALTAASFRYDSAHHDWTVAKAGGHQDTLSGFEQVQDNASHRFLLVSPDSQYTTIQAAIDAAQNGDTILVAPGSYADMVTVDKAVTIDGANAGIDGTGARGSEAILTGGVKITADGATIDGVKVHGTYNSQAIDGTDVNNGILIKASNVTIENTVLDGTGLGDVRPFSTSGSVANLNFTHNAVTNWGEGAYIVNGHSGNISHNLFESNGNGVLTESVSMIISANHFVDSIGSQVAALPFVSTDVSTYVTGDNTFTGSSHEVSIYPNAAGAQGITGTAFDDVFRGYQGLSPGPFTFNGGQGNDIYYVHAGDTVSEAPNQGIDEIRTPDSFTLPANVENLTLLDGASDTQTFDDMMLGPITNGENGWEVLAGGRTQAVVDLGGTHGHAFMMSSNPGIPDFAGPYSPALSVAAGEPDTGAKFDSQMIDFQFKAVSDTPDGSRIELDFGNAAGTDRNNFLVIESFAGSNGIRIAVSEPDTHGNFSGDRTDPAPNDWRQLASGVDPAQWHDLQMRLTYNDGPNNDVIQVYLDGQLIGTTTTFENFHDSLGGDHIANAIANETDRVFFRPSANGAPQGPGGDQGFYFDNLTTAVYNNVNATGNNLGNVLTANSGNDVLTGAAGSDTLISGAGSDTLNGGGAGNDKFVYNAIKYGGMDQIVDFTTGDELDFAHAAFGNLPTGPLDSSHFAANTTGTATAPAGTPQFVFNTTTSTLFYDPTGSGGPAIAMAHLENGHALGNSEIHVV